MEEIEENRNEVNPLPVVRSWKSSDEIQEIAAAWALTQGDLEAAHKRSKNPHHGNDYADINSYIEAIREPLSKNGIAFFQFPITQDRGVSVETVLIHKSGQWISGGGDYVVPEGQSGQRGAQAAGSALTYARRYSLTAVLGLRADDDDGNATVEPPTTRTKHTRKTAELSDKEALREKCREFGFEGGQEFMDAAHQTGLLDPITHEKWDDVDQDDAKGILKGWDSFIESWRKIKEG